MLHAALPSSSLDKHIPAPAPESDQCIPTVATTSMDQNVPALRPDSPPLISTLDYNIPALVTALDQTIPTLISTDDNNNNIPNVQKEIPDLNHGVIIPSRTPNPDQGISPLDLELEAVINILNNDTLPQADTENALMPQIAKTAMEELMKLLRMNEPFWFRSLIDGKFVLQRDSYQRIFRRSNCLRGPHARIESSKDSRVVKMSGTQLVEMFLNSLPTYLKYRYSYRDKWVDLFPTIVKKAQTIQVLESGSFGNRNGALLLMNAETHILSPLVPTREFHFLRFCNQLEAGVWAIGDVSLDSSKSKTTDSRAWRLPSGCLIQEMTRGSCWVTWVEHVEVDDKIQTHDLFREVIIGKNAYGAERWVSTLERMCERFASASAETIPSCDAGGVYASYSLFSVIRLPEGRKSVMHLAHRMVKGFCGTLDMQDNTNFSHLTRMNNGGVRVSVRVNNTEPGVPKGMILSASTSFWLPLSPQNVFDYLIDNKQRAKWDVLCCGSAGHEIQLISTGSNPGNCISIMR
ncbi:Homeobox-leucine zipper protein HDG11, partial [Mucuna pruriens]